MDREAWRAAIHGIAKSQTWLSDWTDIHICIRIYIPTLIYMYIYIIMSNIAFQRMVKMLFLRENVSKWFKIIVNNRITVLILLFFTFRIKCIWIFILLLRSTLVTKWKFFAHCFSRIIKEVYSWPKVNCFNENNQ